MTNQIPPLGSPETIKPEAGAIDYSGESVAILQKMAHAAAKELEGRYDEATFKKVGNLLALTKLAQEVNLNDYSLFAELEHWKKLVRNDDEFDDDEFDEYDDEDEEEEDEPDLGRYPL